MDGRNDQGEGRRGFGRGSFVVIVSLCALALAAKPGAASPIRGHHLIVVKNARSLGPAWARFLTGGPSLWAVSKPPRFPSGLVLPTQLGKLVETPFVDYLFWRKNLNPARFAVFHPNLSPELVASVPQVHVSHLPVPAPRPIRVAAQNLPEPTALPTAVVLIVAGFGWRGRLSKRRPPGP